VSCSYIRGVTKVGVRFFRSRAPRGWRARASVALAVVSLAALAPPSPAAPLASATAGCPARESTIVDPVWSPDAKQIAWVLSCKKAVAQVWIAAADGSRAHAIARNIPFLYQLAWVRTGGLLYSVITDQLWRLSLTGRRSVVVSEFQPSAQRIPTDAAGDRVAWGVLGCACEGPIHVKSLFSGWTKTIGTNPRFSDGNPTLSPDGQRVAFERERCPAFGECGGSAGIWVSSLVVGGSRRISSSGGNSPEWSPDGRSILYDDGHGHLIVVSPSGRRKATFPVEGATKSPAPNFAWSPNSRNIAVWSHDALVVFGVSTVRRTRVTPSSIGQMSGFAWSPDSKTLLVSAGSSCPSLWLVGADGSTARGLLRRC